MSSGASPILQRYLRWRRPIEVALWAAIILVDMTLNMGVAAIDARRMGMRIDPWEPVVWEATSTAMWALLIPAIIAFERRMPLQFGTWGHNLPWHAAASIAVSIVHVAGMFALRAA